jgi:hypothetical protein
MSAIAGKYNFIIQQGDTWQETLTLFDEENSPIDLTSYSAVLNIKSAKSGTSILSCSTTGSYLTIPSPSNGQILILVPSSITTSLSFGTGVYDLKLTKNGFVTRYLEGSVNLSTDV